MSLVLKLLNRWGRLLGPGPGPEPELLILLGPPRSNSTLIHRMLAEHSAVVAPRLGQLVFPGRLGSVLRWLLARVPQSLTDKVYDPRIHRTGAEHPEADDIALMSAHFEGLFAWVYGHALVGAPKPMLDAQKHLSYLGWLRSTLAGGSKKTIVSKYFAGLHHFEALQARHPQAKFALLLRDPKRVCSSLATLVDSAMRARGLARETPTATGATSTATSWIPTPRQCAS